MTELVVDADLEATLEHFGVKGMRWGTRKDDSGTGKPSKPKKLTKDQVKAEQDAFYQAKANRIMETASKDPESLIALKTQHDAVIVTGNQFVHHMMAGGVMDIRMTDVYATRPGGKGPYVLNPNINQRYVRSDKRK